MLGILHRKMYNKEKQEQKADDKNFENIVLKTKDKYWIASRFSDCNTEKDVLFIYN